MPEKMQSTQGSDQAICQRLREELLPMLYGVANSEGMTFENPFTVSCWETTRCGKTDCAAYGNTEFPCWYRTGTYCDGETQGTFLDKSGECRECDVFKMSCPTIVEEIGEALNHLLFSLRQQRKVSLTQMKKIEHLNKELVAALENLDTRNREIQELVITDRLTGLYNRNYLLTVLDDEIARFQRNQDPLTVMMIDLDDFKSVNDTYGHAHGDVILTFFGNMLLQRMRKCDRSFRYGGEEFMVVLPDTDLTVAWILAERVRKAYAAERFAVETGDGVRRTISLTLSVGLASYVAGMSVGALLKQADEAMYLAKTEGKNRVVRYGLD